MKIKLILFANFFTIIGFAQIYQLKDNMLVTKKAGTNQSRDFSTMNSETDRKNESLNKFQYLEKIGELGDDAYFKIYSNSDNYETIIMNKYKAKEILVEDEGRWSFGIMSLPMKIRFEGGSEEENNKRYFDFESGFNIGLSIGYRINKNVSRDINSYAVFSIGTSQVRVTSDTTNGEVTSDQVNSAFSPTAGLVLKFKNDLQFITIIGIDYLSGKVGEKWVYKDKPFLGIGIGFSAFKFGEKPTLVK